MRSIYALVLSLLLVGGIQAKVIKYAGEHESLQERWQWAFEQIKSANRPVWIGYSIRQEMAENSRIGSWSHHNQRPTIAQLVAGVLTRY